MTQEIKLYRTVNIVRLEVGVRTTFPAGTASRLWVRLLEVLVRGHVLGHRLLRKGVSLGMI